MVQAVQIMLPTELPTTTVSTMEQDMVDLTMAKKKIQIHMALGASTVTLQTLKIATKLVNTWIVLKMKALARHKKLKTSGKPVNVDQMQLMVHQSVANVVTNLVAQKISILILKQNGEKI